MDMCIRLKHVLVALAHPVGRGAPSRPESQDLLMPKTACNAFAVLRNKIKTLVTCVIFII